jgi:hypothetical protein
MVLPSWDWLAGRSALPVDPGDGGRRGMPTEHQGQAVKPTMSARLDQVAGPGRLRSRVGWVGACGWGFGHASTVRPDPSTLGAVGERGSTTRAACSSSQAGVRLPIRTRESASGGAMLFSMQLGVAVLPSGREASSTSLGSNKVSRTKGSSAPTATRSWRTLDLPAPGSPPSSRLRSGRVTVTSEPSSSTRPGPGSPEELVFAGPHGGVLRVTLFRRRFWRPAPTRRRSRLGRARLGELHPGSLRPPVSGRT